MAAGRGATTAVFVAGVRPAGRLAWAPWGVCAALVLSGLLLGVLIPGSLIPPERPGQILATSTAPLSLVFPTVGALVASRLPANPIGWPFCGMGVLCGARQSRPSRPRSRDAEFRETVEPVFLTSPGTARRRAGA